MVQWPSTAFASLLKYCLCLVLILYLLIGCGDQSDGPTSTQDSTTSASGVETTSRLAEEPLEATDDPASREDQVAGKTVESTGVTPLDAEKELAPQGTVVTVQRAIEGDTFRISPAIKGKNEVKLIGIDAPEVGTQPFGDAAVTQANSLVGGRRVALGFDNKKTDDSGRILVYVRLPGGNLLNEFMVLAGYAQVNVSPPNVRYEKELKDAQRQARNTQTGIWALPREQLCLLADHGNGIGGGC